MKFTSALAKSRSRKKKLSTVTTRLHDYINEILPVKSEQNYRLQMITDEKLYSRIQCFLLEQCQLQVGISTIRLYVKKNYRRCHVSKLISCQYCFMLSDTSVILNSELRLAYEAHQQVMNSQ